MVLGIQLPLRFIDVEDQLAMLDPLPRLRVRSGMAYDRFRREDRLRLDLCRGRS